MLKSNIYILSNFTNYYIPHHLPDTAVNSPRELCSWIPSTSDFQTSNPKGTSNLPCKEWPTPTSQTYFHATGGSGPLTFVSYVRVGECHLIDPKTSANGRIQRLIEGAVIAGEWDQLVAVIGHVINQVEYKAQIQAGYVLFATALMSPESGKLWVLH